MRRGIYILVIRGCFFLPAAKQTVRLLFFLRFLVVRFVLVDEHGLPALFGSVRLGIHLVIRFLVEVVVTFAIFPSASKQTAKQAALLRRFLRKMVVAEDVLIFLVLRLLGRRVVLLARAHRREQTGRIVRADLLLRLRPFRFLLGLFLRQTRCLGLRLFRRLGFRLLSFGGLGLRLGFFRGLGFCLGLLGGLRLGLFRGLQRGLLAHAPFASGQRLTLAILYGRIHLNAFVGVLFFHRNFLLPGNRQRRFGLLRAFHFLLGDRRFRFFKRRGRVLRILLHLGLGCHRFPGGFILLHRLRLVRVAGVSVFLVDFVVLRVLVLFVFLVLVGFLVRLARYEFAEAAEHSAERNATLRLVVFFVLVVTVLRVLAAGFGLVFLVLEIDRLAVLVGGLGAVRGGRFRRKIDRLRRLHGRLGIRFLLGFGFEGLRLLVGLKHAFVNALQIVFPVFLFFLLALEKRPEALKRGLLRLGGRFVRFAAAFLVRGLLGLAGFLGLAVRFLFVGSLVLRGFTLPAGKLFLQTRAQTQNQRERAFLLFVGFLGVRLVLIEDFVLQLLLGVADLLALLLFQLRAHGTARLRRILRRFHRGLRGRHGVFQAALAARLNIALGRVVHLLPVGGFHGRGARARALCRRGLFRGRGGHGRGLLRGRSHPLSLTALLLVMQPLKFVKAHIRGSSPVFSCHL